MLAKVSKEMFRYNGLRAIYLMLGNRCNLGCSHCHQVYEAEHIDKSIVLSPAMIKYSCHNGNEIVDHISSGYIKIMKTIDSYVKSKELPKCKTCTFRTKCSLCRCKSTVKKGDKYYVCSYYRRIYRFVESLSL